MKMVQIRNVPDDLHSTLKARAALAGQSLSDYLLGELRRVAARPSLEEVRRRLAELEPITLSETSAEAIRAVRDERDARWS